VAITAASLQHRVWANTPAASYVVESCRRGRRAPRLDESVVQGVRGRSLRCTIALFFIYTAMHVEVYSQIDDKPAWRQSHRYSLNSTEADSSLHMSLTCQEEIGRVGRVGRGCYEDASDLSATRLDEFEDRHDTRTNGQHSTVHSNRPSADQLGKRWKAERGSRPTRPTSS